MNNPYWGKQFFDVIFLFCKRMGALLTGQISLSDLASDEIQILVLAFLALASALVGTFLVLRKMTMLANALSHTILLGIVVAYLCLLPFAPEGQLLAHGMSIHVLLIAALISGLVTTALTQLLVSVFRLQEDASTGLIFTTLFALGIIFVTALTRNTHLGIEAVMGNVDALHLDDLYLIAWIALTDCVMICVLFKEWKTTTFDAGFAEAGGFSAHLFNYLLMVLTSITAIGAFRAVGVLLVLAFLVIPVVTARLFCHRLKWLIGSAIGIGVGSALMGVAGARHLLTVYDLPVSTAGLTVTSLGCIFVVVVVGKVVRDRYYAISGIAS